MSHTIPLDRLSPLAASELVALGGARDPDAVRDLETLARLLSDSGFPAHAAVLAFEEAWGGLAVPMPATGPRSRLGVGVFRLLDQGLRERGGLPDAALVPIAAVDDFVYFMDAQRRVWGQHLVSMESAVPLHVDGDAFVQSQMLWQAMRGHAHALDREGSLGATVAAHLNLPALPRKEGEPEQWWGHGVTLVVDTMLYGDGDLGQPWTHLGTADPQVAATAEALWRRSPKGDQP